MLWRVATGNPIGPLRAYADTVPVFSPDGRMLLTTWEDRLWLWDVATAKPTETSLPGGLVRFSADGRFVLSVGRANIQTWDIAQRKPVLPPIELEGDFQFPSEFSPDGRLLLSWGRDGLQFWDVATGRLIGPVFGPPVPVNRAPGQKPAVVFSPDGHSLINHSDAAWQLWDLRKWDDDPPRVAAWVERITGLAITPEGEIKELSGEDLRERTKRLAKLGGSPEPAPRAIGPDPLERVPAERARELIPRAQPDGKDLIEALDQVIRAQPTNAEAINERGFVRLFFGLRRQADDDFIAAFALGHRGPELLDRLITDDSLFTRALARAANDTEAAQRLWIHRAGRQAREQRWNKASADYRAAIVATPRNPWLRWYQFLSLLAAEDHTGAHLARKEMLGPYSEIGNDMDKEMEHFQWIDSEPPTELAWIAALAPGRVEAFAIPVRLAKLAVELGKEGVLAPRIRGPLASREEIGSGNDREANALIALGAVLYRARSYQEAIGALEQVARLSNGDSESPAWAFLAMAHHHLGHRDEALRWLGRLRARRPNTHPTAFWDELEIRLLRSEAEAVILYDPVFPADPFAH
jgi:tetratricopeptide (TPR) repeat protein